MMIPFLITCEENSARISRRLDGELGGFENFGMLAHLAVCIHCRRFRKQVRTLRRAFQSLPDHLGDSA